MADIHQRNFYDSVGFKVIKQNRSHVNADPLERFLGQSLIQSSH